jgi:hypothetical protein
LPHLRGSFFDPVPQTSRSYPGLARMGYLLESQTANMYVANCIKFFFAKSVVTEQIPHPRILKNNISGIFDHLLPPTNADREALDGARAPTLVAHRRAHVRVWPPAASLSVACCMLAWVLASWPPRLLPKPHPTSSVSHGHRQNRSESTTFVIEIN